MTKTLHLTIIALAVACFGMIALAGNSGVSDPTVSLNKLSPTGGRAQHDMIVADLTSLETAVEASIDVLDAIAYETGSATNGQVVTLTGTYTAAPVVVFAQGHATSNAYASTVTTTNFTAVTPSTTNKYVVIPAQ
jgi:hypothetical protein